MAAYWKIAAHSVYKMFSKDKYLSVNLVFFPPPRFWSGNFFLHASFPDHSLLVPFYARLCMHSCLRVALLL